MRADLKDEYGIVLKASHHAKAELRARMRQLRRSLTPEFRTSASGEIVQRLRRADLYQSAHTIHTYVAWQEEVENHELLRAMLREGKSIVTPKVNSENGGLENHLIPYFEALVPGAFGILEPSSTHGAHHFSELEQIDLIIVPGLAFDRQGNRLGYGGGYYDRLLAGIVAPKVAFAFDVQIVDDVPIETHDCVVDYIITEREVIFCREE